MVQWICSVVMVTLRYIGSYTQNLRQIASYFRPNLDKSLLQIFSVIEGQFILTTTSFLSPFFVKVQWKSQVNTIKGLFRYKVITRLILDGNQDHLNKTTSVLVLAKHANEYTVKGLQPFSKIEIQVVAMGTDGPLKYSTTVVSGNLISHVELFRNQWLLRSVVVAFISRI